MFFFTATPRYAVTLSYAPDISPLLLITPITDATIAASARLRCRSQRLRRRVHADERAVFADATPPLLPPPYAMIRRFRLMRDSFTSADSAASAWRCRHTPCHYATPC